MKSSRSVQRLTGQFTVAASEFTAAHDVSGSHKVTTVGPAGKDRLPNIPSSRFSSLTTADDADRPKPGQVPRLMSRRSRLPAVQRPLPAVTDIRRL